MAKETTSVVNTYSPFPALLSYKDGIGQPLWVVYFPDEPCHQQLRDLLADGPMLPLVEATRALLHRLGAWSDLQGMLGDFSQNAQHVQGFICKDVSVDAEEVDERTFLFGGKRGANAHRFTFGAAGVYEDLLSALH